MEGVHVHDLVPRYSVHVHVPVGCVTTHALPAAELSVTG